MSEVPEDYSLFREEIRFEHSQINDRMTWYLTSQTILAGAFALVESQEKFEHLVMQIGVLGAVLSVLIFLSVFAAARKVAWIRANREIRHVDQKYYVGSALAGGKSFDFVHRVGLAFPYGTPCAFLLFWCWLLVKS